MRYELLLVMIFFLGIILMCAELLWLYLLSDRQEEQRKEYQNKKEKTLKMLEAIMYAPTASSRIQEEEGLFQLTSEDNEYMEILTEVFIRTIKKFEQVDRERKEILVEIIRKINPISYYEKMLEEEESIKKSYACQKLSALGAKDSIPQIRECLESKNRQLKYAAGSSLAVLGDKQGVEKFLINIQEDRKYSYRIINEVIDRYTGDLSKLSKDLIDNGDSYLKATVIKSIGKYKIEQLIPYLLECVNGTDINLKIAATKALCYCAKNEHLITLIRLSNDQNWVVREFAVKALSNFNTEEAIEAVKLATQDKEWWVRQAAAESLIKMDYSLEHIESVIKGYDRYASEAVKYSLYKILNLEEKN